MTKNHLIEFKGRFIPAERFLLFFQEVKKVKYNGEILYNVLLEEHGQMRINNLLCETLHPDSSIAKLCLSYDEEEKNSVINEFIKTNF